MTIQLKAHIFSDTGSHKKAAQHQLIYDFQRYITTALLISFMDSFSYIFFLELELQILCLLNIPWPKMITMFSSFTAKQKICLCEIRFARPV